MQINFTESYNSSFTKKAFDFLFVTRKELRKSTFLGFFNKLYLPLASEVLILLAIGIVWYKSFLGHYLSIFNQSFLPLILVLLALVLAKKDGYKIKKSMFWLLAFLAVALISAIIASLATAPVALLVLGWVLFAQFVLVFFLGKLLTRKVQILKYLIFLSLPMTLAGLYQFIAHVQTSSIWVSAREVGTNRVFAFLGSPNVLGVLLSLVALLSLGIFLEEKKKLFLLISLMNIFVVGLTLSRSAWLGLLFGFAVAGVLWNYKYLIFAPLTLFIFFVPQIRNRILAASSSEYFLDSTLDGRIWSFINGAHILKKNPVFGTGPGTYGGQLAVNYASPVYLESIQNGYTALYYTDNQFLELLVQTGILGFISFLGFIIAVFVELIEKFKAKHSKITLAVIACFVCFLVASVFANNLEFTAVAMPMALMLGVEND